MQRNTNGGYAAIILFVIGLALLAILITKTYGTGSTTLGDEEPTAVQPMNQFEQARVKIDRAEAARSKLEGYDKTLQENM